MFVKLKNQNIKMKTTTKLLSILLLIMLTQSCTKNGGGCETPQSYYIPLKAAQLNQTPYFTNPAFDTISFASDKGDTLTFVKTKTDTTWYEEQGNGNPDCGYDKVYSQTIHNTYATIKGNGSFDVKHIKPRLSINSYLKIEFNNYTFYYDDISVGNINLSTYLGDFSKNGKQFKNVFYVFHNDNDSISSNCYINHEKGLFLMYDNLNVKEYLINK